MSSQSADSKLTTNSSLSLAAFLLTTALLTPHGTRRSSYKINKHFSSISKLFPSTKSTNFKSTTSTLPSSVLQPHKKFYNLNQFIKHTTKNVHIVPRRSFSASKQTQHISRSTQLPSKSPQCRFNKIHTSQHASFSTQHPTQQFTTPSQPTLASKQTSFLNTQLTSTFASLTLPGATVAAGSVLYLTAVNEQGETTFSQQIPSHFLLNDDDEDDQTVIVVPLDSSNTTAELIITKAKKHYVSLDMNKAFTSQSSQSEDSLVSSADLEFAQSNISSSTSSSNSSKPLSTPLSSPDQPKSKAQPVSSQSSNKHQHNTTSSVSSSYDHTTSGTDYELSKVLLTAELSVDSSGIIGAPPAEFLHPFDKIYSKFWKVSYSLVRFCSVVWTFFPFIRHWLWTHHFHVPTPQDRHDMLNNLSKCIEQSGCAFIKFGQWLSMRPDIFPQDVIEVLSRLRDGAPAHGIEETRQVIREEFDCEIADLFLEFNTNPVASGSIAQVYKGKLHPQYALEMDIRDHEDTLVDEVAIKIRHPGVLAETWIDLDIIYFIVDRIPGLCIPFNKEELKLMIQYQIDFRFEGHYLSRFCHNFSEEISQGYIAFPYVSPKSLHQAVLIESWAGGQTVGDIFTEVGDLFRPVIRHLDGPAKSQKTLAESMKIMGHSLYTVLRGAIVEQLYYLADNFDIKIDHYNSIQNSNHKQVDTTLTAQLLRSILPPRSRIGEQQYKWDPNLSEEENRRFEQKKILAYTLFDMFIKMFLRDNLIHADLHAGNVLYDNNSFKHTATVLDAGMTVALEPDIMQQFGLFLRAICDGDPNCLVEACSRFEINLPSPETLTVLPPLTNKSSSEWQRLPVPKGSGLGLLATNYAVRSRFHHDINDIFDRFYSKSSVWGADLPMTENVSIGDVVGQVLLAMQTHGVILRGDVAASIMAMSVIEGLLRQLDPELDIVVNALPYFMRYKRMEHPLLGR